MAVHLQARVQRGPGHRRAARVAHHALGLDDVPQRRGHRRPPARARALCPLCARAAAPSQGTACPWHAALALFTRSSAQRTLAQQTSWPRHHARRPRRQPCRRPPASRPAACGTRRPPCPGRAPCEACLEHARVGLVAVLPCAVLLAAAHHAAACVLHLRPRGAPSLQPCCCNAWPCDALPSPWQAASLAIPAASCGLSPWCASAVLPPYLIAGLAVHSEQEAGGRAVQRGV